MSLCLSLPLQVVCHTELGHEQVLPVYCFDPRQFCLTPWNNPKTGNFRAQFLLECVLDLQAQLRNLGSILLIRYGRPEVILKGERLD